MFESFPLDQIGRVAASLVLVILAMAISRWQRLDLEKSMLVAVVRAFIQLTLIGYALTFLFEIDSPLLILLVLGLMTSVAGYTSGQRAGTLPQGTAVALGSIGLGASLTLGLLVGVGRVRLHRAADHPHCGHGHRQLDERLLAGDAPGARRSGRPPAGD